MNPLTILPDPSPVPAAHQAGQPFALAYPHVVSDVWETATTRIMGDLSGFWPEVTGLLLVLFGYWQLQKLLAFFDDHHIGSRHSIDLAYGSPSINLEADKPGRR